MSKKRRNGIGRLRRLANESLILSCTSAISSWIVRVFETGFLSPLLTSVAKTDSFIRERFFEPIEKKIGLRRNVMLPARNAVAGFFAHSRVFNYILALKDQLLSASMRSAGVFLLTFGIYAAAIFALRQYVSLPIGSSDVFDIVVAFVTFLVGLILLIFGDKSVLHSIGSGRITGTLLEKSLGINRSSLLCAEKGRNAIGIAFLAGSLFGIGTLFYSPGKVLCILLIALLTVAIFNVPEFGLLLFMALLPFTATFIVVPILLCTTASYLFKCVRLKRNFRFGTADVAILCLFVIKAGFALAGGGSEVYTMLCYVCVYFITKNVVCSGRLISQAMNSICLGASVAAVLWLVGNYAAYIPSESIRDALILASRNTVDGGTAALFLVPVIPLAISKIIATGNRVRGITTLVLVIACTVVADKPVVYILEIIAVLVYCAVTYKSFAGAALAALLILPPAAAFASAYPFGSRGYEAFSLDSLLGGSSAGAKFWAVAAAVFTAIAVLLSFQRIFSCMRVNHSRLDAYVCGASASAAVVAIVMMIIIDPFADVRSLCMLWFILGLQGSVYGVYDRADLGTEVYG